jgi:penicillin-binding protein 1A
MDYERRQVYRGPKKFIDMPANALKLKDAVDEALSDSPGQRRDVMSAVVSGASKRILAVRQKRRDVGT